jgi:hypothetical protein
MHKHERFGNHLLGVFINEKHLLGVFVNEKWFVFFGGYFCVARI